MHWKNTPRAIVVIALACLVSPALAQHGNAGHGHHDMAGHGDMHAGAMMEHMNMMMDNMTHVMEEMHSLHQQMAGSALEHHTDSGLAIPLANSRILARFAGRLHRSSLNRC